MKNIILIFLCLFSINLIGQVERQPNLTAKYFASQSGGGSGYWTLTGTFTDDAGIYDASGVQVGDVVFFSDGTYTFFLPVTEIVSATHPTLTVKVSNTGITQISSVPSGMKAIYHPTSKGYFPFVSGISNADQQVYNEYLMSLLDQGGGSCEMTVTQTAHAFSPWTPLIWNGSEYERPTNDTIIPDYIVIDSVNANTFKVASCGTYATDLTNGMYWYTNEAPGYSLVQDTVKVPLFNVVQGKLSLRPLIGFNLGETGGSSGPTGIYAGSDSLSQPNTYAAMAADGSQNFGIGYFPSFPVRDYDKTTERGLLINPGEDGVSLSNLGDKISLYEDDMVLSSDNLGNAKRANIRISGRNNWVTLQTTKLVGPKYPQFKLDSLGILISDYGGGGTVYRFLDIVNGGVPSTTAGRKQLLNWTAGLPSFSDRYISDTLWNDAIIKMASSGNQNFSIGYFPAFPNLNYNGTENGFYHSPNYWGGIGIVSGQSGRAVANIEVSNSYSSISTSAITNSTYPYGDRSSISSRGFSNSSPTNSATFLASSIKPGTDGSNNTVTRAIFSDGFRNKYSADYYTSPRSTFDRYGVLLGRDTAALTRGGGVNGFFYRSIANSNPSWTLFQTVGGVYPTDNRKDFKWIEVTMPENDTTGNGIRLYEKYNLPNSTPTNLAGMYSIPRWNGLGVGGTTPVWKRCHESQLGPAAIPAGGIITVNTGFTFPLPFYDVDITMYDLNGVGTNLTWQIIAQTETSFSVKFFVANTGSAASGGNYVIYYKLTEL